MGGEADGEAESKVANLCVTEGSRWWGRRAWEKRRATFCTLDVVPTGL